MIRPLAMLPLALAACATRSAESGPLVGYAAAGEPVDCIPLANNVSPQVVDQRTILYHGSGRRIYRTGPQGTCPALRPLTTLIFDNLYGSQLCRNDRFRVLEPGATIPSNYCLLDRFTPYEKPAD